MDRRSKEVVDDALKQHRVSYSSEGGDRARSLSEINREEVKARLEGSEARVASAISEMRVENAKFLSEFAAFRGDMLGLKAEVSNSIERVRTDHAKDQVVATRWQIGLIITVLIAAIGGITTTVLRTSGASHVTETQQPAPIIIQVPSPPAAATPVPTPAKP